MIISNKQLDYALKLGGTASVISQNILAENGSFDGVIHLHKKLKLTPDINKLINYFIDDRHHISMLEDMNSNLITKLEYIKNDMGLDFFSFLDTNQKNYVLSKLLFTNDIELLKYFINTLNIKPNITHMYKLIEDIYGFNNKDMQKFKFLESYDLIPTKDMFLKIVKSEGFYLANYLFEKYNYVISIKDVHNLINGDWISRSVFEYFHKRLKVNFTPYTVKLIVEKYLHYYNKSNLEYIINHVGKITQETFDLISTFLEEGHYNFLINCKYNILEYEPDETEIPDIININENIIEERDYLDEVLN